ncbi:MAG: hypothetical protein KDD73_14940, partial [Anaerolineales bacterium]|nr:hypothetical protein [Anaerolineales bacterium]
AKVTQKTQKTLSLRAANCTNDGIDNRRQSPAVKLVSIPSVVILTILYFGAYLLQQGPKT